MSKPSLKVTSDFQEDFNRVIKEFKNDEVLVGIPEDTSERNEEDPGAITNAALLAINEYGSPANNIPPRPVLAADALFQGYERVGIIAANSVKKAINSQEGIEEPAVSTILARRARGFKGTKALVVTGQMRNAITSVTRTKL